MGITREQLSRVDQAETFLRDHGFRHFRVRFHDDKTARIEVGPEEIPKLMQNELRQDLISHLKNLGFTYITLDLQGYRTGSMNEVLSASVKQQYST